LRCYGVRVDILRQCPQETDVHESECDHGILTLPRESARFPGKSENLCCIQLDLSPFCKIDAHLSASRLLMTPPEAHFARIRSVEPLVITSGTFEDRATEC
jgi:hypothetical protein